MVSGDSLPRIDSLIRTRALVGLGWQNMAWILEPAAWIALGFALLSP